MIRMVNERLMGGHMSSVLISIPGQVDSDFGQLCEAPSTRRRAGKKGRNRKPLSYAELVQRSGITNIIFRYSTGTFHALDANGEEVVSGKTVKDIISAL